MLIVEYDGTRYHGSQFQENGCTIQGEIERALYKLMGEKTRIAAASRTDAGVHAKGQVVSFDTQSSLPLETYVRALNHYMPRDIAVSVAYEVKGNFDVRRDALRRAYRYHILNRATRSPLTDKYAYLVTRSLDIDAMNRACQALVGEHDFAPFSSRIEGSTVRTVYRAEVSRQKSMVMFDMEASSFLLHQVRNTVGGLVNVGLGKIEVETFRELAYSGQSGVIGPTAPAHGLCLMKVNYADKSFQPLVSM